MFYNNGKKASLYGFFAVCFVLSIYIKASDYIGKCDNPYN